jgi:hypothetical protein
MMHCLILDRGPCLPCFVENGLNMWDLLHGLQMWHVLYFLVDIPPLPVVPYELQWHITEAIKQVTQDMLWQICKEWNYWDIAEQQSRHVLDTSISFNFPKCYVFSCQCNCLYMHSIVLQLSSRFWPTMHMYTVYDFLSGHFRGVVLRSQGFCNFCIIRLLKIVRCKTILPVCCVWLQCLLFLMSTFIKHNRPYLWILKQHSLVLYILQLYLVVHIWIVRLHWKPAAIGSPLHCICAFNILLLLCKFVYWF